MPINEDYFLSPAHFSVAEARYFLKDENGQPKEKDIEEVFRREANHIYQKDSDVNREEAFNLRCQKKIMPAGRPLSNAGTAITNLFNCFVLPIGDTREEISEMKARHFHIQANGGGVGCDYSDLRPAGSVCRATQGHSSGAIGFITDISYQSSNIQQGGQRSGANLGILHDWHPDLYEFITFKSTHNHEMIRKFASVLNEDEFAYWMWENHHKWQMFNVSVALSDRFMEEASSITREHKPWMLQWKGTEWPLWDFENTVGPYSGADYSKKFTVSAPNRDIAEYKARFKIPWGNTKGLKLIREAYHLSAKDYLLLIAQNAWEDGCPGVFFMDTARKYHNLEYCNPLKAANPCQPKDATVLTPNGIRTIGDIEIGDIIWSGKQWTTVTNKWSTGVKDVYEYHTRAGIFLGTENHRVVSEGTKVKVKDADSVDTSQAPYVHSSCGLDPQDIIDGLVLGDGGYFGGGDRQHEIGLYIGRKDQDYFISEVSHLIRDNKPYAPKQYVVDTTITKLCAVHIREVPARFLYANNNQKMAGFLRGLYSANGSVVDRRVTLKSASFNLVKQVQIMLSALGIKSYYTINKQKETIFKNGTYLLKQSYDLNISTDRHLFAKKIGFIHKYKTEKLNKTLDFPGKEGKTNYDITECVYRSTEEVFDITVDATEHTYWTGGLLVSNCGEQILGINCSCNLTSIVLPTVSEKEISSVVYSAVRGLDNTIDISSTKDETIDNTSLQERRVGLGTIGIAEHLIMNKVRYSSQEGRDITAALLTKIRDAAYRASIELAKERGAFPAFDFEQYSKSAFFNTLPRDIQKDIEKYGIRNGTILTQAPTGSTGTITGYSQGCEPYFAMLFNRNSKVGTFLDGSPAYRKFLEDNTKKYVPLHELKEDTTLITPAYFEEAHEISVTDHLKMQAVFAKHIDSSVSKTINMSNDTTATEIRDTFINAWKMGIKSTTVYRDGSKQQVLERLKKDREATKVASAVAPSRPKELECDIHHVTVQGEKWTVIVGLLNNKPYEIFCALQTAFEISAKYKSGKVVCERGKKYALDLGDFKIKDIASYLEQDEHKVITRLLSSNLRHGVPVEYLIKQLNKADGTVVDLSKAIARVLRKYEEQIADLKCEKCGSTKVVKTSTCYECLSCSYSKCG